MPRTRPAWLLVVLGSLLTGCEAEVSIDRDAAVVDAAPPVDGPPADAPTTRLTIRTYEQRIFSEARPLEVPWLAVQDGNGAWTELAGAAGVYEADVRNPDGRYGVAVGCSSEGVVRVVQSTLAEASDVAVVCPNVLPNVPRTLRVDLVTAGPCTARAAYAPQQWTTRCAGSVSGQVRSGPHDLLVATGGGLARAYVARDVDAAQWSVDLDDAERARPAVATRLEVDRDEPVGAFFLTGRGLLVLANGFGDFTVAGFPAALRQPADIHLFQSGAHPVTTWLFQREPPAVVDLTGLPAMVPPVVTVGRSAADWDPYDAAGYQLVLGGWEVALSTTWLRGATRYDLPRLCDAAGFPHPCVDGEPATEWSFTAFRRHAGAAPVPAINAALISPLLAPDGLSFQSAVATGTRTP